MASVADVSQGPRMARSASSGYVAIMSILVALGIGMTSFLYFWTTNPFDKSFENILLGGILVAISLWPFTHWLLNPQRKLIPFLALYCLFYSISFGLASFITNPRYISGLHPTEEQFTLGIAATIISLCATYLGWIVLGPVASGLPAALPNWLDRPLFGKNLGQLLLTILFGILAIKTIGAPAVIAEPLGVIAYMCLFWLMHSIWSGTAASGTAAIGSYFILPTFLLLYSGLLGEGSLMSSIRLGLCLIMIYMATHRRLPVLTLSFVAAAVLLLQPVKSEFRYAAWSSTEGYSGFSGLMKWIELGYDAYFGEEAGSRGGVSGGALEAYARMNHLQATSAIIDAVDTRDQYLNGRTYAPILTKLIPRVLWPNKPIEDLGNQWAQAYGMLGREDRGTAFNLPWLPEMYMNWGWTGVLLISFIIGGFWRVLDQVLTPGLGGGGRFAISLAATYPMLLPESNMSLMVGSFMIAIFVCIGMVFILSRFRPRVI